VQTEKRDRRDNRTKGKCWAARSGERILTRPLRVNVQSKGAKQPNLTKLQVKVYQLASQTPQRKW
jgi:hypothetical protein